MSNSNESKQIAKNTILLYIRMIVITLVSFYTTRVILQLLGVEDFGIRNVVSGIIGFMNIITTSMVNAAQRFLAYDLGKNNIDQFRTTFSMLVNISIIFAFVGILLLELVGPLLIANILSIPIGRLFAAQVIFQFTILSFILSCLVIPYTSAVISTERMNVFAYISLFEAFLKLIVVFVLYYISLDKLIAVVGLTVLSSLITNSIYFLYCKHSIDGCIYRRIWDKKLFNQLTSFMGWNLFGSATSVLNVQGQALLLNIFFGPIINAAKAIADNVNQLAQQFISNFYMAVGPQIIKSYAAEDKRFTKQIVLYSSKFAFFLISAISIPLIKNMRPLLSLWLGSEQVTNEMVVFSCWVLVLSMIQSMDYPITQTVRATGSIKKYQVVVGCQTLLFFPICLLAFYCGSPAITSMIILCVIYSCVQFYRVVTLSKLLDVSVIEYYKSVVFPIILVVGISSFFLYFIRLDTISLFQLFLSLSISFIIVLLCAFIFGVNKNERSIIVRIIKNRIVLFKK